MPDDKFLGFASGNVHIKHYRYVMIIIELLILVAGVLY